MNYSDGEDLVEVVLEGGPDNMAQTTLARRAAIAEGCLKIEHHGGYEHFERVGNRGDPACPEPIVFRWSVRTRMAE